MSETGRDGEVHARGRDRVDLDDAVAMEQHDALTWDDDPGIDATTDSDETDLNPDDDPATPALDPDY